MYKIYFEDNSIFESSSDKSEWNKMPSKSIVKIEYKFENNTVLLEGFEAYNHVVEKIQFINKQGQYITKIILMGKHNTQVYQIIFDFQHKRAYQKITKENEEYNENKITGWKKGIGNKPIIRLL